MYSFLILLTSTYYTQNTTYRTGELMLSGWTLLATHCPICNSALLRKQNQTKCAFCNMPVLMESDYEGHYESENNAATNNNAAGVGGVGGGGTTSSPQSQYFTDRSWMFRDATEASRPATISNTSPVTRGSSAARAGLSSDDSEDSRVDDRKLGNQQRIRYHIISHLLQNLSYTLSTHPFNISLNTPISSRSLTHPLTNSSTSGSISQPVYEYKNDNGINTTPSPSRPSYPSPTGEMNKSGAKDVPARLAPPSLEDAKKEYDRKHRRIDTISSRLGEKMLAGWTLLGATCPEPECCSSPLMSIPGGVIICVGCDQVFEHSPYDGRYAPVRKVVSPSKFSSHPNERSPVSLGGAVLGAVSLSPIVSKQTDLSTSSSSSSSLRYANNNSNTNNDSSASPTTR